MPGSSRPTDRRRTNAALKYLDLALEHERLLVEPRFRRLGTCTPLRELCLTCLVLGRAPRPSLLERLGDVRRGGFLDDLDGHGVRRGAERPMARVARRGLIG